MSYAEQRELGLKLYGDIPKLRDAIASEKCWPEILKTAKNYKDQVLSKVDQWPSKWAYWWARDIGDREIMQDRVTESEWAFDI